MVNGRHVDLFIGRGLAAKRSADKFGRRRLRVRVLSVPGQRAKLPPWDWRHSE
jgi:hypothetical protein